MWFDGLVAIVAFNACLLLDVLLVKDAHWMATIVRTATVTPISLVVNEVVRRNPSAQWREGTVAVGMLLISLINLAAEGHHSTASTLFGTLCLLITALFVGVVMRLRFGYAMPTLIAMMIGGVSSLAHAPTLTLSEAAMGASMLMTGCLIVLVTCFRLESEQRKLYLLGLQHDLQAAELAWANQALKELSNIDNLTGLPNRRALDERVALLWKSCAWTGGPLSVIVVDIDHFKSINDSFGHPVGDEALRHLGSLLPRILRSPEDLACRFGGEEFVLLLPEAAPADALAIAERVRSAVESAAIPLDARPGEAPLRLTVSCGVSTYHPGGLLRWNDLIVTADQALYEAKRSGRNRVEFFACQEPESRPHRTSEHSSHARRVSRMIRGRISSSMGSRAAAEPFIVPNSAK